MDAALKARPRPRSGAPAVTRQQWDVFFSTLRTGIALRQAALTAGIRPEIVYERRRADEDFARLTNRLRA
ncbi:hypothetical protein [Streptomyces sp. NPDC048606]|uniref:hypothetical protein n=1 Tax=Streptomyces sp. NPDC048606 TaxID=3154726 RepID=UPI00342FA748